MIYTVLSLICPFDAYNAICDNNWGLYFGELTPEEELSALMGVKQSLTRVKCIKCNFIRHENSSIVRKMRVNKQPITCTNNVYNHICAGVSVMVPCDGRMITMPTRNGR